MTQLASSAVPEISDMGETALLLTASETLSFNIQERIWRLGGNHGLWPGVTQTIIGVNNLLVLFDPDQTDAETLERKIWDAWHSPPPVSLDPRHFQIPVHYGGADGMDLTEVSENCGMSEAEYVSRHAAGNYVVTNVGAYPGFGYLGGLDPALAVPRRASPRPEVKAGAIMIGGSQTSIFTVTAPTGWNIIGHTDERLLDLKSDRPSLLSPGDRVTFVVESGP